MYKIIFLLFSLLILGCSSKKPNLDKDTDLGLHKKIFKYIKNENLDDADNTFLDLEADYPSSIYIKSDLLNLFLAHLNDEEYQLAKFYLNEYEKRFASEKEIEWCEFQKIRIDFLRYSNAYTNQELLLTIQKEAQTYLQQFPNSPFSLEVSTILSKDNLTIDYLNDKIKRLYIKLDKPKAAKEYNVTIPKNSKPPYIPWYKKIFYW